MPRVIRGKTDLWTTAPHIANLLLYPEHGYELSLESHKKDDFVCPCCGTKVNRYVRSVTRYGFRCPVCSDGVSYPEKFVANMLKQLDVDFIHDNSYEWSDGRRYDFYIEEMSLMIETHGIQHYLEGKTFNKNGNSLEKQKLIDEYKRNLAIKNNIKHYIELDCRYSSFDYIKNSILNSKIPCLLNLSLINWTKLANDCFKSKIIEACELYNSGIKNTVEIAKLLNIDSSTVSDYLRRCDESGLCKYEPNKWREKAIICVDTGKIYNSLRYVGLDGFDMSQVSACCHNKPEAKTSGGYNWCFYDEYNLDTYVMKVPKNDNTPKRVLCVETGKIYDRLSLVKEDGFNSSQVSAICNGKEGYETHRGYHFKFVN